MTVAEDRDFGPLECPARMRCEGSEVECAVGLKRVSPDLIQTARQPTRHCVPPAAARPPDEVWRRRLEFVLEIHRMKRVFSFGLTAVVALASLTWLNAGTALARKQYSEAFIKKYVTEDPATPAQKSLDAEVKSVKCGVCHMGPGGSKKKERNAYGAAYKNCWARTKRPPPRSPRHSTKWPKSRPTPPTPKPPPSATC